MWVEMEAREFPSVSEASQYLRELGFEFDYGEPWYYGETDETWRHKDGRTGCLCQRQSDLTVKVVIGASKPA